MSDEFLGDRRKALEDSFFQKREKELLEKQRQALERQSQLEQLRSLSGVSEDDVLEHLIELGISAETFAAISLNTAHSSGLGRR